MRRDDRAVRSVRARSEDQVKKEPAQSYRPEASREQTQSDHEGGPNSLHLGSERVRHVGGKVARAMWPKPEM
jgi:hypothetical protein